MVRSTRPKSLLTGMDIIRALRDEMIGKFEGEVFFYNLDNYRKDQQVKAELEAMASRQPAMIGLCEVVGNTLPALDGYKLIRSKLRDGSTLARSRSNIALYVRRDLPVWNVRWIDCEQSWPRTQGPGTHEPRSYLSLRVGLTKVIVAHQPQRPIGDADTRVALYFARQEGISRLALAMTPKGKDGSLRLRIAKRRPVILMADFNARSGERQGPDTLAAKIDGRVYGGERIDNVVARGNVWVSKVDVVTRVAGVALESDHHHAIRFTIRFSRAWLPFKKVAA